MPNKPDINRRQAVLETEVRLDGRDESPVVNALTSSEFSNMNNLEATKIAILLKELLDGQKMQQDQINLIMQKIAERDEAARKYEQDQEKFMMDVYERAEKLKVTGNKKNKLLAKGANTYQKAHADAVAKQAVDKLNLDKKLAGEPLFEVISQGTIEMRSVDGVPHPTLVPEIVRLAHKKWVLPIGRPVKIPLSAARVYLNNKKLDQESEARKNVLAVGANGPLNNQYQLQKKWREINEKYGTSAGDMVMY